MKKPGPIFAPGWISTPVRNLAIWGNHSETMYPDFFNAKIKGRPVPQVITDEAWLKGDFITSVQQRGAAILKARGASSAASAAVAIVDSVYSVIKPTHASDWHSLCICSDGSYGVEPGLISSFPIHSNGHDLEIVHGLPINEFSRARIDLTVNELKEEKAMVKELLGS